MNAATSRSTVRRDNPLAWTSSSIGAGPAARRATTTRPQRASGPSWSRTSWSDGASRHRAAFDEAEDRRVVRAVAVGRVDEEHGHVDQLHRQVACSSRSGSAPSSRCTGCRSSRSTPTEHPFGQDLLRRPALDVDRRRALEERDDVSGETLPGRCDRSPRRPRASTCSRARANSTSDRRRTELLAALHRVDRQRVAQCLLDRVLAEQRDLEVGSEPARQRRLPGTWGS